MGRPLSPLCPRAEPTLLSNEERSDRATLVDHCAVQVPRTCQPLFTLAAFWPYRYRFLAPANAGLKVIARFKVNVFPLSVTELPARLREHCKFCNVRVVPKVPDIQAVPASLSR